MKKNTWLITTVVLALFGPAAAAEEMRLYAAAALKGPLSDVAKDFEKASGNKVALVFDTAGAAEQKFLADSSATFLLTTQARIRDAEKSGKLQGGNTVVIGDTVAGFAAPAGKAKPDISTSEKLKAALLAAPRIAFSDPARGATVGTHFIKVIERISSIGPQFPISIFLKAQMLRECE